MSPSQQNLHRILALARQAHARRLDETRIHHPRDGFATRVVARWREIRAPQGFSLPVADLWERLCWRAAIASVVICMAGAVYRAQQPLPNAMDLILDIPQQERSLF